jgi:U3 small nucleolar RNA-associated protein MPP10
MVAQAWDDVERRARPADKMVEYSKRAVVDQEKSKLSLGEVYEQQYLKQSEVGNS